MAATQRGTTTRISSRHGPSAGQALRAGLTRAAAADAAWVIASPDTHMTSWCGSRVCVRPARRAVRTTLTAAHHKMSCYRATRSVRRHSPGSIRPTSFRALRLPARPSVPRGTPDRNRHSPLGDSVDSRARSRIRWIEWKLDGLNRTSRDGLGPRRPNASPRRVRVAGSNPVLHSTGHGQGRERGEAQRNGTKPPDNQGARKSCSWCSPANVGWRDASHHLGNGQHGSGFRRQGD